VSLEGAIETGGVKGSVENYRKIRILTAKDFYIRDCYRDYSGLRIAKVINILP